MATRLPAAIGMSLAQVDTPALLLDLDAFERNLARLAGVASRLGMRLRPHAKSHKCPEIALRQMAAGAVGVCCQKVGEAEALVAGGVGNVLVSNEIVAPAKIERLAALEREAWVGVCVDDAGNVEQLSDTASRLGVSLPVLVEINVGGNRCGVPPGRRRCSWPSSSTAPQACASPDCRPTTGAPSTCGSSPGAGRPSTRR